MRTIVTGAALAAFALSPVARAASDPGPMLPLAQRSAPRIGTGVQASISVPLGGRAEQTGPRLSLRAGPSLTHEAGRSRLRRTDVSPVAELALRPGHSTSLSLAGQPIARSLTASALREQAARGTAADKQPLSTLGTVGIVAGVLVVAGGIGLALWIDAIEDNSD